MNGSDRGRNMSKKHIAAIAVLFLLVFRASLYAQSEGRWDFLGDAHVDGGQDHDNIHVGRHDGKFRAIQLRVSGGAVYFGNGPAEELVIFEAPLLSYAIGRKS